MALLIGITGGIGSGKSTLSELLRKRGYFVYDADVETCRLQNKDEEIRRNITDLFGKEAYRASGELNRPFLAQIVFNNAEKLQQLNGIVHPAVKKDFQNWVKAHSGEEFLFQESAILFESGFYRMFDKIIAITASEDIRVERVTKRDNIAREQVMERMARQLPEKELAALADFIVNTDNGLTEESIERIIRFLSEN
ncbi:MAG: dephospho-CoA kinase [Prevotellaceae bacterium]|jgi:dephospho-CoA kinase|nr:dephospho-CoA kinase [Prevotellaceae bacterium]